MTRLEQIEEEIDSLWAILESKDKEFMATTNNYDDYSKKREPYTSKIDALDRERRLIVTPEFNEILDEDDHVMSLTEFIECCKSGGFIDYDGHGAYVKDGKVSDITIYASDVENNSIRKDFDTIVWYNR